MEKRILLAFALSFIVLLSFSQVFYTPTEPAGSEGDVPAVTEPGPEAPAPAEPSTENPPDAPVVEAAEQQSDPSIEESPAGTVVAEAARDLGVETARYQAVLSNEGASLRSLRLRDYLDSDDEMLELIDPAAGETLGWPLAITTDDEALNETIRTALFVAEERDGRVRFEYAADGLRVVKTIGFAEESYGMDVEASLTREGRDVPFSIVWQGSFGDQATPYDPTMTNAVYRQDGDFERLNVTGVEEDAEPIPTTYVGVEDRYFIAMFLLPSAATPDISVEAFSPAGSEVETPETMLRLGVPYNDALALYVGPKQEQWLGRTEPILASVVDYGFFEILARPLLLGLVWIYSYVHNYGWAIIILTLFINFVLFPLRLKQQMSMLKMQKIQPQMRTLQDKYKKLKANDPRRQQVQAEMMGLYKKHGVNPLGGCLPLLLQMPFLFAFFSLLGVAIELRRAPWMLWIQDLSVPDPYFVLPILMGLSMFVMQKMTPTTADPAQARIMMLMPIMLTGMFVWFPVSAGLMLYWLTSNVVGVGQQYFINQYWATDAVKGRSGAKKQAPEPEPPPSAPAVVESAPDAGSPDDAEPRRRRRRGRRKN